MSNSSLAIELTNSYMSDTYMQQTSKSFFIRMEIKQASHLWTNYNF